MGSQPNRKLPKQERLRTRWTTSLDKIFADLVVEQIHQGNRSDNVFDQEAWKYIQDEFNKQSGLNFNKQQLRKHLDVLRTRYYNLKSIFDQSDFGMVESCCMVTTEYDVWEDYIEAHPKPETIKIKDCPIYEQLCTIFTESGADGRHAQSSHYQGMDKKTVGMETPGMTSCSKKASMPVDAAAPSMFVQDDASLPTGLDMNIADRQKKRQSETPFTPGHHSRNHDGINDAIAEAMFEMAASSKLRAVVMTQIGDQFSITNCIKVLDEIQGIDQHLYFAALDLFENPNLRETFISLKCDKRLQGKCSAPSTSVV
ncbi:hypothetical protein HHK36_010262 [Tetracentron sinense]|uniref:Myb/SANT-like domain-containing protein n=1 Tax=Tetracentron sinense TaxID=13715 RepID=A0A835DIZ5_TETSI|nr:hypothetical protein HHK36_010262 [Tetracentron sinense]